MALATALACAAMDSDPALPLPLPLSVPAPETQATRRWSPSVTVAAVIDDGAQPPRFLLVEEHTPEGLKLNNPAGHLDPGESPQQGVVRETLEETARVFTPTALLGVYLSRFVRPLTGEDVTYLRLAYAGTVGEPLPGRTLDTPIVRTLWLTLAELRASVARHRSPLVLQCIEDHCAGRRYPLEVVGSDGSLLVPAVKA
jgi:phosphatase NudJ